MSEDLNLENEFYISVTPKRLSKLITRLDLYRQIVDLRGEIVECGVFKGVSLMQFIKIRSIIENNFARKIIGFDTFGDFPEAKNDDDKIVLKKFVLEAGKNSITKKDLTNALLKLNLNENIELIEGNILRTAKNYVKKNPGIKISLLHIDVDLYNSTKCALETFYPLVVKNGIIILDDYGAFPGANKAIEEYFSENSIPIKQLRSSNAISYIVKDDY
jgi:hypothetical protein